MESITGSPPKAAGLSKKAIIVGGGVLAVFVMAILVALHKKAEQQQNPSKHKATVTSALNSVVSGVADQNKPQEDNLTQVQKTPAVPEFVENMSTARGADTGQAQPKAVVEAEKEAQKETTKAIHSSLLMEDQAQLNTKNSKSDEEKKKEEQDREEKAAEAVMATIAKTGNQKPPSMEEIQKAISESLKQTPMPAMPQMASSGGGGGGGGGVMPGYGMGMNGIAMPTISATNPTPDKLAAEDNKWLNSQEKGSEKPGILKTKMYEPGTNYFLSAGDIIPAVLTREIKTSSPGTAEAIVSHDVYNDAPGHENEILIPANSTMVGTYNSAVNFGQTRVQIVWKEIHLPDGRIITINGEGADMSGTNGLHDEVNNHYMKMLGAVAIMSLFDVGPLLATPPSTTSQLSGGAVSSMYGESLGMNASEFGMQYASNAMNISPTLTIRPSYPFNVVLPKTVVFNTYYSLIGDKK
jgi:type IV secretion system protein VirB10